MVTERELLKRAAEMRRNPTEWEMRTWRALSNSKTGYKFRRQAVLFPYIVDFFCPAKGLVVEIDGDTHDIADDARRDTNLTARGFKVLRFCNLDVRDNMDGVVMTIVAALTRQPDRWAGGPHPNPSPEGEGLE